MHPPYGFRMPELPEVETTVRGLRPVLVGKRIASIEARRPDLRRALPIDLRQRMTGAVVTSVRRRAKYGLIDTDRGDTMIFHLGMSGHWRIDPAELGSHDHLVIDTDEERRVALNDARRFGSVDAVRTDAVDAWPQIAALGPEPLGAEFDAEVLAARLSGRTAPIKAMLMDGRIVAGLGNIYVCEALNMARISPARVAGRVSLERLGRLVEAIREVLSAAIEAGGSTLRDFRAPDGSIGYFPLQYRVYGRDGEACPCGGTVKRRAEGGRSTFYCPRCQR